MLEQEKDYRKLYSEEQITSQRIYDKTLLTLSSGAFAVSFAFMDAFITGKPVYTSLIISGWGFLTFSILLQLGSHLMSVNAFKQAIKDIDSPENADNSRTGGKFAKYTDRINYASGITFAIGIFLILTFVYFNFN
ncbi:hypothetical protein LQ318_01510 [Aliifodinibius salicampi]|uniref:DUF3899 domain-containing protein n=1 Tax=Fodinibius salicampi TaxID=1920655 RepID=A0ABT3PUR5_9BACT|nr:hypothetical protein [Fodinibius salicampi]MCW9711568.1 hypothetical protein [Fodinibius salicampi]